MRSIKIGIDIRFLSNSKRSGIEEYAINLIENFVRLKPDWKFVLFYNLWGKKLPDFAWLKAENVEIKTINFPGKILSLLFLILRWPKVDKLLGGIDVFFMPNFASISLSKNIPLLLIVHDLSFLYFKEFFSLKMRLWQKLIRQKYLMKRANKIIAVSNSTKNDILRFCPQVNISKIKVIHHGISKEFKVLDKNNSELKEIKQKYNLPEKFVLYLGIIEPRKNIESVVKSFNILKNESLVDFANLKLVIAGKFGWKFKKVLDLIKNSKHRKDIILLNNFELIERVYLNNLAEIFVWPSFFEGFGFPVLEAMASGAPVICSNTSSMPEVVGDAGILINPYNINDLILAQKQVLLDENLKNHLVHKGLEQAKKFSWEKCAQKTIEILEKVIKK